MDLSDAEKTALKDLAATLRNRFGAVEVSLFGSAARGEMDRDSDIDIFVVVPDLDGAKNMAIVDECFEVSLNVDRHVSPLSVSVDRLRNSPFRSAAIVKNIREEGPEAHPTYYASQQAR